MFTKPPYPGVPPPQIRRSSRDWSLHGRITSEIHKAGLMWLCIQIIKSILWAALMWSLVESAALITVLVLCSQVPPPMRILGVGRGRSLGARQPIMALYSSALISPESTFSLSSTICAHIWLRYILGTLTLGISPSGSILAGFGRVPMSMVTEPPATPQLP